MGRFHPFRRRTRKAHFMTRASLSPLANLWDEAHAANLDEPGQLLYRSNLLGSDLRITNFGGGNTSAKVDGTDPLTKKSVSVLWVKGSGGDIGSMKRDGFATLYLDKLEALKGLYRGLAHEDEMVALFDHCTFNLNPRASSIDTPLHAFVPARHVDHVHADAVIAIAASSNSKELTKEVYGDEIGYLPWQRPGFDLGLELGEMATNHPEYVGVVLGGHGLFTWGPTSKSCYETTLRIIQKAADWLAAHEKEPAFYGARYAALAPEARREAAARLLPAIRGKISSLERKVGHFSDAPEVLEFVNSNALGDLAPLGTSCPDHFLRTKIRPLVLPFDPDAANLDEVLAGLDEQLADYRDQYAAYYDRCKRANSPAMRDPNAVVYLVPGIGVLSFAKDKATARIASEFYVNAINVMRGACGVSTYVGLAEQEAFDIEYWLLEEAKLQRLPKPKALAGRIALITGGAGGIGRATAARMMSEGACVVVADIDQGALDGAVASFAKTFGKDVVRGLPLDVTSEAAVAKCFTEATLAFGGLDIVVSNAGIASASPIEDTSLELWNKNVEILSTGYFLVSREAFRLWLRQGRGGNLVFVASKNGLAASPGASAYCAAKASEIHLARCLALEGAPHGIRVNTVNPDAVLRGSKIWQGEWRQQRAQSNKVSEDALEEVYRQRSMLKLSVFPEDIAEGVYFFVSDAASKSTGNILNVDAGNVQSFTR
jgi:rhamnulose-1-phosphate aldolase/alcohol dehydrogenase